MIWEDKIRAFKRVFRSDNSRFEKLVPREYADEQHVIEKFNFGMILEFQKTMYNHVLWEDDQHKEFAEWIEKTKIRIEKVIPYIEKRDETATCNFCKKENRDVPFAEKHKYCEFWEKQRRDLVCKIISEMSERIGYFWT